MGFIVLNPESLIQFQQVREPTELRDPMGRVVGVFHPASKLRTTTPISREQIEEQREQKTGRPLEQILEGLANR